MHVCFFSGTVEYRTHICFTRLDVHMSQASVVGLFCFFVSHWNYGLWDSPVFLSVRFILSSGVRFIFSRGHCSMRHMYFALWNINKLQACFFLTGTVSYETQVFCCMGYKLATGMCYFSLRLGVWNTHVFLSVKFKYVTSMCFFLSYSRVWDRHVFHFVGF